MNRKVAQALLGAAMLAALAGCAYQDPLALPDLGPPARSSQQQYPGYSPYYGSGYNYSYGYGSGYRPGYDPYYSQYYGGGDPRYYAPGVVYVPYPRYVPVPCADANGDGRCDQRPPKNRGHHDDAGDGGDRPDDKHNGVERPPRPRDDTPGDGPRVRRGEVDRYTAPGMTPLIVPRAPATPNVGVPPPPRPAQARPPEPPRRAAPPPDRGPRVSPGRPAPTSDDRSTSRPTPEP